VRATGQWFSPGPFVSSTNKTDRHNITEILLKVALNSINQTKPNLSGERRIKGLTRKSDLEFVKSVVSECPSYISLYVWFHNFSYSPSLTNVTVPTTKVFF
jgi:hypothetical protein